MHYFESMWKSKDKSVQDQVTREDWNRSQQILSQVSPSLVRILQAGSLIGNHQLQGLLFEIHLLLDVSWDELRTTICSLRSFTDEKMLLATLVVARQSAPNLAHFDTIMSDLACGVIRVIQQIVRGELSPSLIGNIESWSWPLQQCLLSPNLLQDVHPLLKSYSNLKNVDYESIVHWLKAKSCPPTNRTNY
ncbi:hypothetical protein C8R45DRAFT_1001497 [Mycena sanguinolenta]|nr:hypothetical protein C8R45DRAFT_1001497 [Mycena sanguinolenta]